MTTNNPDDVRARVRGGLALLAAEGISRDEVRTRIIDMGRFDLTDYCGCVLAAVYGTYDDGVQHLGLTSAGQDTIDVGFTGPIVPQDTTKRHPSQRYWDVLIAEWVRQLDLPDTIRVFGYTGGPRSATT